jgi:Flp pilus assembly pilin Flp
MEKTVYDFIEDEDANSAIEYALVIVLVIATTSLLTTGLKAQLTGMVSSIGTRLNSAVNTIS